MSEKYRKNLIYDIETLSKNPTNGVILCIAGLVYDESRFVSSTPYTFGELVKTSHYLKFNVEQQVKQYGRKIEKDTIDWWAQQDKEAREMMLTPSKEDRPLESIIPFLRKLVPVDRVLTRGNTFDPLFVESVLKSLGSTTENFYSWWTLRDTRSTIEGLSFGTNMSNKYIPPGLERDFVAHDPRHDIAMDVMRIQELVRALYLDDDAPFTEEEMPF